MFLRFRTIGLLVSLVFLVGILGACRPLSGMSEVGEIKVKPSTTVPINETVSLTIEASGDGIQFKWAASQGSLSSSTAPSVLYTAPSSPGFDKVTVEVTSARKHEVRSIFIEVIAPTPTPTPPPVSTPTVEMFQKVADFESYEGTGVASPENTPANSLSLDFVPGEDREGIVARIEYEMAKDWTAFWIKLKDADFSPYDVLTFYAKGDFQQDTGSPILKLELKRNNSQIGVTNFAGLTNEWRQFEIPLAQFEPFADMPILCGWDMMSELWFTFEYDHVGAQGIVYLDDIYVERRGEGAPPLPLECEPPALGPRAILADFNNCASTNNLGGAMGAAYDSANRLEESYVDAADRGCLAQLEYDIVEWSAFWMQLENADFSSFSTLIFDIKGDPEAGIPGSIKIELKRAGNSEVSIIYVSGITSEWQTIQVKLNDFGPTGYTKPLSALNEMEELVFVFEARHAGPRGVVYLDNIGLEP